MIMTDNRLIMLDSDAVLGRSKCGGLVRNVERSEGVNRFLFVVLG